MKPRKNIISKHLIALLSIAIFFASCEKDDDGNDPKTSDFDSPGEIIENPDVKEATENSSIEVNKGDDPPALAGEYETNGEITETSSKLSEVEGTSISTVVCLYDQTSNGLISFRETVGEISASGIGGYITGDYGKFTIWGESEQSEEAGLPEDISITVVILISGQKLSEGDLAAKGVTVFTEVHVSDESEYSDEELNQLNDAVGEWYMWEADFNLQGSCSGQKTTKAPAVMNKIFDFLGNNND